MSDNPRLMKAKLSQSGIHCSIDWVTACLDWLTGEQPGLTSAQVLLKLQEQWLITDLTTPGVMDRPMLPPNLSECVKEDLPGQYTLQVQHGHDVSSPAYGQLQKLHQVDRDNARVSADDSQASQAGQGGYQATQGGRYQQCWEPRPQRIMMLTITDGFQTVEAMEHQVIKVIPDVVSPGMKVQVLGPVTVRRGIIMLTSNSVRVLGGQVEELQEQFSLQSILQQKIGKEDVGQKGNMFATQARKPPPAPRPAPHIQAAPASVPTPSMDSMSDDDDIMLLAASQLDMTEAVTSTQASQPTARLLPSQPAVQTHSSHHQQSSALRPTPSHAVRPHPSHTRSPPVGVVQPLRTLAPSNQPRPRPRPAGPDAKEMKSQSSMTSFMVSKSSNSSISTSTDQSSSTPSFSLLDSDDEFMSDLPLSTTTLPAQSQTVPDEPFQYLINVKAAMQARPEANILAKLKVVSSTLASKMSLRRTVSGPQWQVAIMINDGSDSIKADMGPELLDKEIGPANQYVGLGTSQQHVKAEYKERIKQFSVKLAEMSCLVTIKVEGEGSNPTIVKMEEISGLHTALMRKRRLL
eukprot:GFUD01043189.1.p1 GENE.GFUD01043189.1~~GFUD01043189.1.p1  ORF type:complete len:576 (-),score=226.10 GFUD01043189.1:202-1929(-)